MELDNKLIKEIQKSTIPNIILDLVKRGLLLKGELKDAEKVRSVLKRYWDDNSEKIQFDLIVDHRFDLLELAKKHFDPILPDYSITLYATFIEHTLNKIIHEKCAMKGFSEKTKIEILRSNNINSKCTWLLTLLDLPPLNEKYKKLIYYISESRNTFIHYKWKAEDEQGTPKDMDKLIQENLAKEKEILSLVKYLKGYEARVIYKGDKNKFSKALT